MKLLLHEKILGLATVIFITLVMFLSLTYKSEINIAVGSETAAVPYFIDINTADTAELETLDGIGSKIAVEIVKYREKHGEFKSKDELCEISGIGNSTLDKIKDYIKV